MAWGSDSEFCAGMSFWLQHLGVWARLVGAHPLNPSVLQDVWSGALGHDCAPASDPAVLGHFADSALVQG